MTIQANPAGNLMARTLALATASLTLLAASACSQSSPHAALQACTAQFSGNITDSATLPAGCGTLSSRPDAGADGECVLNFQASSNQVAAIQIAITLDSSPSPGTISSETAADWSAVGLSSGSSNCGFSAGNNAVPTGSFTLTLSSVDAAEGDGNGTAHGTLDLTMYVHAPPAVDCGAGDIEDAEFVF